MKGKLNLKARPEMTLRDNVCETLQSAILTGEFEPGERLKEVCLAEQLGVSRTPVREALQILEKRRLVTLLPKKGAVVEGLHIDDLGEVAEIHTALEILAIHKACQNSTPEQKTVIERAEAYFESCCQKKEALLCSHADEQFHQSVTLASGNKRLIKMLNEMRELTFRYRLEILKDPSVYPLLIQDHRQIMKAVQEGNVAEGEHLAFQHIFRQSSILLMGRD